jgi:hypothetical protein
MLCIVMDPKAWVKVGVSQERVLVMKYQIK